MKIDFDYIRKVSDNFKQVCVEDPNAYDNGRFVFSVQFEPETGLTNVHVQWPYFRNLVANSADAPAVCTKVYTGENMHPWMYWTASVLGCGIVTCVNKFDIIKDLRDLVAEHPESDYEICEDDDIENLFSIWQNMTGWNLGWPKQEVATNG